MDEQRWDPQAVFEEVLLGTLAWPGTSVRLERDSVLDHQRRITSPAVSVAELYHVNSLLDVHALAERGVGPAAAQAVRVEYVRRRAENTRLRGGVEVDVPSPWPDVLARTAAAVAPSLFYAVELSLWAGAEVISYEPVHGQARLERGLDDAERLAIARAFGIGGDAAPRPPVLVLVGCLARNEILVGRRSYRQTALEVGRLTQAVSCQARLVGVPARVVVDFEDLGVNRGLGLDGVERSAFVAIGVDRDG